jgi:tetratricopeptide (TPR) repeat protein
MPQPPQRRGDLESLRPRRRASMARDVVQMLILLIGLAVVGSIAVVVIGMARYGSPDGLVRRVNAEVKSYLPKPAGVPTPLATIGPMRLSELTSAGAIIAAPSKKASATPAAGAPASATSAGGAPQAGGAVAPANYQSEQESVQLAGMTHNWQTWNNCGPATLAMNLSYFGNKASQADVAAILRPDRNDANVGPDELAFFARGQGFLARSGVNGDSDRLRLLLSNGLPVLIETWHEPKPNDGMGHYRLVVGYDNAAREWIVYDSYDAENVPTGQPYIGIRIPYDKMDALWRVFNRAYTIVYDMPRAALVQSILGDDWDEEIMWQRATLLAQLEIQSGADGFGWFNLGAGFNALGQYEQAAAAFDQARRIGLPWRMLWYQFAPFEAYYEVGRYDEVIALVDATLKTAGHVEELHYWKGMAFKAQNKTDLARGAWQKAVELNPNYAPAARALAGLDKPMGP